LCFVDFSIFCFITTLYWLKTEHSLMLSKFDYSKVFLPFELPIKNAW